MLYYTFLFLISGLISLYASLGIPGKGRRVGLSKLKGFVLMQSIAQLCEIVN